MYFTASLETKKFAMDITAGIFYIFTFSLIFISIIHDFRKANITSNLEDWKVDLAIMVRKFFTYYSMTKRNKLFPHPPFHMYFH